MVLFLYGIKFATKETFNDRFLDKIQTDAIKGIFIYFVFIRHILQYVDKAGYVVSSMGDKILFCVNGAVGQLIVVMFLFYSGYGIAESFKRKGGGYIKSFPRNRIFATHINFDIAILFFLLIDLYFEKEITVLQLAFSLIGWDSIGNSNWYIFDILICYIITYIVFEGLRKHKILLGGGLGSLSIYFISQTIGSNKLMQWLGINSLVIMLVHEPVKRIVIKIYGQLTNLPVLDVRSSLLHTLICTILTIGCVAPFGLVIKICTFFAWEKNRMRCFEVSFNSASSIPTTIKYARRSRA